MAKDYLIRISVYPYIRKYLLHHFSEPFFVTENGYIPGFIYNALEPMPKVAAAQVRKKDKVIYGEHIGILVGERVQRKKGVLISSENVKRFNAVVADVLHDEMYAVIQFLKHDGNQVDDTIRAFQQFYQFTEDELPFENLKRWYYRERKRREDRFAERLAVKPQFTLNFYEEVKEPEAPAKPLFNPLQTSLAIAS